MKYRFQLILLASLLMLCSCRGSKPSGRSDSPTHSLDHLKSCMSGTFSSKKQSLEDSAFYPILLRMEPIEAWNKKAKNKFYLYVEQAMATAADAPYRQRVYEVEKMNDTLYVSWIYLLPDAKRFIGTKGTDPIFAQIADSLLIKAGCEVFLKPGPDGSYKGGTLNRNCASDRAGATWTSSEVVLTQGQMVSWDRGWNDSGEQVWGAVKGGYIFIRE